MPDARQQEYNRRLVGEHVHYCHSMLVSELLQAEWTVESRDQIHFSGDDIENYRTPKDEGDLRYDFSDEAEVYDHAMALINVDDDSFERYLSLCCGIENPAADLDGEELEDVYPDEYGKYLDVVEAINWHTDADWDEEDFVHYLENCLGKDHDDLYEDAEIYEWWCVSSWLAAELKDKGEAILDNEYGTWWGRQCSGQAILLDYVITQIEQEHHWMFADPGEPINSSAPDVWEVLKGWRNPKPFQYQINEKMYRESYKWAYQHTIAVKRNAVPEPYFSNDVTPFLVWGWRDLDTGDMALAFWHESSCDVCKKTETESYE